MRKLAERIKRWWKLRQGFYVTMDMRDSSVSFSRKLYARLEPEIMVNVELSSIEGENRAYVDTRGKVMMFWEPESECYGFVVSPKLSKETQLADVQFNTKYGTVGFESLIPTVARVLYDYGIVADRVKLSVTEQKSGEMVWYRIERGR